MAYSCGFDHPGLLLIACGLGALVAYLALSGRTQSRGVPRQRGLPFIGSWAFFTRRHRFLGDAQKRLGNIFAFRILHHQVFSVAGEDARKTFLKHKDLRLGEGYNILLGGGPARVDEIATDDPVWYGKRLTEALRRDRLAHTLPLMFKDLDTAMKDWSNSGIFDPFNDIYQMVFQLTIRAAACREIADDPVAVNKVTKLYWNIERGSTPASVLLPWWPSSARALKRASTTELNNMLEGIIADRRATGRTETDTMQMLMDMGESTPDIIAFITSTLFAGIVNTGIISSWALLFLNTNSTWKSRAVDEIRKFIDEHATAPGTLSQRLAQVPPEVWDEGLPAVELCLRETMRIVQTGALLRRNASSALAIGEHTVPRGAFVALSVASVHHDPAIYPEPMRWDPERFAREEDKKEDMGFIGWGAGRHPCLGMRFAKLEMKAIMALFLARYEYEVVDAHGEKMKELPPPQRDNLCVVVMGQCLFDDVY